MSLSGIYLFLVVNHRYEPQGKPMTKITFQGTGYFISLLIQDIHMCCAQWIIRPTSFSAFCFLNLGLINSTNKLLQSANLKSHVASLLG